MKKYLVEIEFRYNIKPKDENDSGYRSKKIAIAICEDFDKAALKGNKALEIFENHFPLNKHWNRKERFSKNGGCFGHKKNLITDSAYLETPFSFFASIKDLEFNDLEETLLELKKITNKHD